MASSKDSSKRKGGGGSRLTKVKAIEALRRTRGLVAPAARSLGVDRTTLYRFMERCPEVAQARDEMREVVLDDAETVLIKKAIDDEDTACLIYLLKTVGKVRGYGESRSVEVGGGEKPVEVKVATPPEDVDSWARAVAAKLAEVGALAGDDGEGE